MPGDSKVWIDFPRGYMPQSIEELEEFVMAAVRSHQPSKIIESSGRLVDGYFLDDSHDTIRNVSRQHSRELSEISSLMGLPFQEVGFYTGIVNGKEKAIFWAHTYPRTVEEGLKYFAPLMPIHVRFLFLNPGDIGGGDFETAYRCPECGYWIEGRPFHQHNENILISDHSVHNPTKASWHRVFCALPSCAAILDESDEMDEIF